MTQSSSCGGQSPVFSDSNCSVRVSVGVVVIGRNEGERLQRCFDSLKKLVRDVVYVDSGSTDLSVATARHQGIDVVELDMKRPFCAARARNAGYQRLVTANPHLSYVQFIDADCELRSGWLKLGANLLSSRPEVAIVAGWVNERSPEASIYNRLGDLEWNFAGAGEVKSVGGIFMIRRDAFDNVGGFDATISAGEEPELCQRLARNQWKIIRLEHPMALHDLAMTQFTQWWKRQLRYGYGSIDVARRFGWAPFRRSNNIARIWSVWLFMMILGTVVITSVNPVNEEVVWSMIVLLAAWPTQLARIALRTWRRGKPVFLSIAYAYFLMVANWPQMLGQLSYWIDRLTRREFRLIEHKSPRP